MRKTIYVPLEDVHVLKVSSVSEYRAKLEEAEHGPSRPAVLASLWECVDTDVERPPSIREAFAPAA
jgi:hypothetical protein